MEAQGTEEIIEDPVKQKQLPLGKPMSTKLTPSLLGDVLQSWNFMWRFLEVLGLKKGLSFEELTTELDGSSSDGLFEAHILMLQVLISEFQMKFEQGGKRTAKYSTTAKRSEIGLPLLNDLTWPELARRYILAVLSVSGDTGSVGVREGIDVFRCLYGDGGPRCGALTGVAGLEADAWVFAAAVNNIYGSLNDDSDKLAMDEFCSDKETLCQNITVNEKIPVWVQELEPVKKLKTNVGSKIRNCIYSSLAKEPPEWAREILAHSISKEVYRANASGPTKKLALNVVAQFHTMQQNLAIRENRKNYRSISDIVIKQCRIVLRRAAVAGKTQEFCNKLGVKLMKPANNEEGILGYPAMVLSLLYFRMIDMRLATGVYCGSHGAFAEDVREFWRYVQIDFGNDSELVEFAKQSCHVFESLFDKEVVALHLKLVKYSKSKSLSPESKEDIENIIIYTNEIPKAPWDEGLCRVCGLDQNNKKVLLCDTCNAEYHTYCLSPPLSRVPEENWFCPSCVAGKDVVQDDSPNATSSVCQQHNKRKRHFMNFIRNETADLAAMMQEKEYWELSLSERTILLKFFCDEMLDSALIREHLKDCGSSLNQHKQSTSVELQAMKDEEDTVPMETGIGISSSPGVSEGKDSLSDINGTYVNSGVLHKAECVQASSSVELSSMRNEVLLLKNSFTGLETKSLKNSLRSEFLGVDSTGKLYWIIDSGTNPWIIVNEFKELNQYSTVSGDSELKCLVKNSTLSGIECLWSTRDSEAYPSWACYQSDAEITRIMDFLKDDDPIKRQLEESIWLRHKPRLQVPKDSVRQDQKVLQPSLLKQGQDLMGLNSLMTKATKLLEFKYGPVVKLETTDIWKKWNKGKVVAEGNLYRCECLEPILPAGHHCLTCHKTCFTTMEFKLHGNGKCSIKSREISIALNGEGKTSSVAGHEFLKEKGKITCYEDNCGAPNSLIGCAIEVDETQRFDNPEGMEQDTKKFPSHHVAPKLNSGKFFSVPVSSTRQLTGKASDVLTQLKITLLDMEAAVPKDALRASKVCIYRRWAWRLFVKCARTIYEMVQATIVFEDMIKLEYLDRSWKKYWSSLSAAANTSTLAALSLRIYSLDAAINYERISCTSNSAELGREADNERGQSSLGPLKKPHKKQRKEKKEQIK